MATKELQTLRRHFNAAYKNYLASVKALADASERGEWPAEEVITAEEKAFNELAFLRQALLGALLAHAMPP